MQRTFVTACKLALALSLTTGCPSPERAGNGTSASTAATQPSGGCDWTRVGQSVTFRAEVMPSVEPVKRTFRVSRVLPSCRVLLEGIGGEHVQAEFEPAR